jgi:hypothetical protein
MTEKSNRGAKALAPVSPLAELIVNPVGVFKVLLVMHFLGFR